MDGFYSLGRFIGAAETRMEIQKNMQNMNFA